MCNMNITAIETALRHFQEDFQSMDEALNAFTYVEPKRHSLVQGTVMKVDREGAWVNICKILVVPERHQNALQTRTHSSGSNLTLVTAATGKGTWVSTGTKSEGLVPFSNASCLAAGYNSSFLVNKEQSEEEPLILSCARAWAEAQDMLEKGTYKQLLVKSIKHDRNNPKHVFGADVEGLGVPAFAPLSELMIRNRDLSDLQGNHLWVKIIRVDPEEDDLIVSQRELIEEYSSNIIEHPDLVSSGVVVNVVDFGAFCDIGYGVIGLLHKYNLLGIGNRSAKEYLVPGQKLDLKLVSTRNGRFSLGLSRQTKERLQKNHFLRNLKDGQELTGVVMRAQAYGVFVRVGNCMDGLLHAREMKLPAGTRFTEGYFKSGEEVKVFVLKRDLEQQKIWLSMHPPGNATEGG